MKLSRIALLLVPAFVLALALAPNARAGDEEGPSPDLKKRIQQKMEKILELMKKNEEALLKLSTGEKAKPQRVDIEPPPPEGGSASSGGGSSGGDGASGSSGGSAGAEGDEAARKLEEIVRAQGGTIPDELKQLVEMIPL